MDAARVLVLHLDIDDAGVQRTIDALRTFAEQPA